MILRTLRVTLFLQYDSKKDLIKSKDMKYLLQYEYNTYLY